MENKNKTREEHIKGGRRELAKVMRGLAIRAYDPITVFKLAVAALNAEGEFNNLTKDKRALIEVADKEIDHGFNFIELNTEKVLEKLTEMKENGMGAKVEKIASIIRVNKNMQVIPEMMEGLDAIVPEKKEENVMTNKTSRKKPRP